MPLLEFRCKQCGKLLAKLEGKAEIKCPRCGKINYKTTDKSAKERRK